MPHPGSPHPPPPSPAPPSPGHWLAGLWAAELLGLIGKAAQDYAREVAHLDDETALLRRLERDLAHRLPAAEVRHRLAGLLRSAAHRLRRQ